MKPTFEIARSSRKVLLQYLENYTPEQLNKVPPGFNNNMVWNIAHIVVVQQMLIYNLSGLPMHVPAEMIEQYRRGTKPERDLTVDEINAVKALLLVTIDQTEADYEKGLFKNFNPYVTMSGFAMNNVDDALEFNHYHEGVHTGAIMAIRKFI